MMPTRSPVGFRTERSFLLHEIVCEFLSESALSTASRTSQSELDRPIFVVGCPRSGTTLLYHMLASSGCFVDYRAELHAFNVIGPKHGNLLHRRDREQFLKQWLYSDNFDKTRLNRDAVQAEVLDHCRSTKEFLSTIMEMMARDRDVGRWAECTPAHLFHMHQIQVAFSGKAKFIHMIRDGRDVALSLAKQGWIAPFPWDKGKRLSVAALFWKRCIDFADQHSNQLGDAYREVSFEQLVTEPEKTLGMVSDFVGESLDYDYIQANAIGCVRQPNSSFSDGQEFNPIERWRKGMPRLELARIERLVGATLAGKNYSAHDSNAHTGLRERLMQATYNSAWNLKDYLRHQSLLGRLVNNKDVNDVVDFRPAVQG